MNYSETEIVNMAVALIGTVANANQDAIEAMSGNPSDASSEPAIRWCQTLYPLARDYAEIKLAPKECLRYAAPGTAKSGSQILTNPGWKYAYGKPDNCLAFLGAVLKDYHNDQTGEDMIQVTAEIGDQILCDLENTGILFKYVIQVTDTTKFSYGLILLIAHRLAYIAARPVGGTTAEGRAQLLLEYKEALDDARGMSDQDVYQRPSELTIDNAHFRRTGTPTRFTDSSGNMHILNT